ncbi:hypothetical protein HYT33_04285 [Candidatus Roizmanbacteria bacterium]|nr:hypothetical protein [Candidatus Roizmanbacteria bacterium]
MQKKIRPYTKYLIKENMLYLAILGVLVLATFVVSALLLTRFFENQSKIETLKKEVQELKIKKLVLDATINETSTALDSDIKVLQSLIPDIEDHFSILFALEELSKKTNFLISTYGINLGKSSQNKLAVTVTGTGDSQSFLNFLQVYNVGGGRLITAEKIELNTENPDSFKLALNFYNQKSTQSSAVRSDYQSALTRFHAIKEKVQFVIQKDEELSGQEEQYERRSNPF